jgi:transcriptional repressor AefR-like protein
MSSAELAAVLLRHGRHTTGPLIERYLATLAHTGVLAIDDPAEAFRLLYGLVIQDSQIRALLGETPPTRAQRTRQATLAVDRFLALTTPD